MLRRIMDIFNFTIAVAYFVFLVSIPAQFWNNSFPPGSGPRMEVIIEPAKNAREIALSFKQQGLVEDSNELSRWMIHFGIDRGLRPGTYPLRKGTPWEITRQLQTARPSYAKFTIIPGSGLSDLNDIFQESSSTIDIKETLMNNSNFPVEMVKLLPNTPGERITFLLPETYLSPAPDPKYMIRLASSLWWKKMGTLFKSTNLSKEEIQRLGIIASLIEKEAGIDKERSIISGVISNRLNKGMPLQIDATVVYAWEIAGRTLTRVLLKDLEIESPFNTYKIKGLPPGPICIPSLASWKASLVPEKHNYLYYVADKNGEHIFSTSYKNHLKAINRIRKGK